MPKDPESVRSQKRLMSKAIDIVWPDPDKIPRNLDQAVQITADALRLMRRKGQYPGSLRRRWILEALTSEAPETFDNVADFAAARARRAANGGR